MNVQSQINALMASLDKGLAMHEIMRADEEKKGCKVIRPGDVDWLSADDWDPSVVVSQKGKQVRLVAILAKNPGHGSLRRTIKGILAAGLTPVVSTPTNEMRVTLKRWGWRSQFIGSGWSEEELWRPTKAIRKARADLGTHHHVYSRGRF